MKWFVFRTLDPAHAIALRVPGSPLLFTRCGMEHAASVVRPAHPRKDRKCRHCQRVVRQNCR